MSKYKYKHLELDSLNEVKWFKHIDELKLPLNRVPRYSKIFETTIRKRRSWSPDSWLELGGRKVYIEIKGLLRPEARMVIKESVKNGDVNAPVIFIFERGKNTITKNSKTTYMEWAEKLGFGAWDTVGFTKLPTKRDLLLLAKLL